VFSPRAASASGQRVGGVHTISNDYSNGPVWSFLKSFWIRSRRSRCATQKPTPSAGRNYCQSGNGWWKKNQAPLRVVAYVKRWGTVIGRQPDSSVIALAGRSWPGGWGRTRPKLTFMSGRRA